MSASDEPNEPERGAPSSAGAGADGDADLLRRIGAGERGDALRELSDRYAARLYDLGLTFFGRRESASRLAAGTLDSLTARAREFDPGAGGSAREFIYAVARDGAAELAASDPEAAAEVPEGESFERAVADVEFRAAVADLEDEGRGVLEAILGDGLTRAEAGERLGLTVGIVEVRLRTALRTIRDGLDARGVVADGRR